MPSHSKMLNLEIAEQPFLISSKDMELLRLAKKAFAGFISPINKSPIKVTVVVRKDLSRNPYTTGRPHRINVHQVEDYITVSGGTFSGWLQLDKKRAEVSLSPSMASLYLFLRFMTIVSLAEGGGFLIHASSVIHNKFGYVFAGRPNSGKSTITGLSSDKKVLCDDFSIIKKVGGTFMVFPSPFWGSIEAAGSNDMGSYPIKGIYMLCQSDENYVRPFKTWQQKLVSLHRNVLVFPRLGHHCENIFTLESELIASVAVFRLYFTFNGSLWRCLDDGQYGVYEN